MKSITHYRLESCVDLVVEIFNEPAASSSTNISKSFNFHTLIAQTALFWGGESAMVWIFKPKNETHRKQPIVCTAIIPSKAQNSCSFFRAKTYTAHTWSLVLHTCAFPPDPCIIVSSWTHPTFFGGRQTTLLLKQTVKNVTELFRKY